MLVDFEKLYLVRKTGKVGKRKVDQGQWVSWSTFNQGQKVNSTEMLFPHI